MHIHYVPQCLSTANANGLYEADTVGDYDEDSGLTEMEFNL